MPRVGASSTETRPYVLPISVHIRDFNELLSDIAAF